MDELLAGRIALVVLAPHEVVDGLVRERRDEARRRRPDGGFGWLLPVAGAGAAALDQEVPHRLVAGATTALLYRFPPDEAEHAWDVAARLVRRFPGTEVLVHVHGGDDDEPRVLTQLAADGERLLALPPGPVVLPVTDQDGRVVGALRLDPAERDPVVPRRTPAPVSRPGRG